MAVAVKSAQESGTFIDPLASHSLVGALYVLGGLGVVLYGIPQLWDANIGPWLAANTNSFVNGFFLLVILLAAIVGLVGLGIKLLGPNPPHGMRAGVFFVALTLLLGTLIVVGIGASLEPALAGVVGQPGGLGILAGLGVALLILCGWLWTRHSLEAWLVAIEDQGWFSATSYKKSQGQRVRRGTILGLLVLAACGVYTLLVHKTLEVGPSDWQVAIPFTESHLVLLPHVRFTVPLLITLASLWLAWRLVNYPNFADFLIATEAEMNKVSWTTRKRLWQDTIVVLTTVFLFTVFLFVVDLAWLKILSWPPIGVLQLDQTKNTQKVDTLKW